MSTPDTLMPFVSAPWLDVNGNPLSVRPLPGLRTDVIQNLECSYPGILSPRMKALLGSCCGLTGTELGAIDFTGCWFVEEPYTVFRPALTLAIDDAERRWIAEIGNHDLPGPVWCVFSEPEVTLHVCDDLATFVETIQGYTCAGRMRTWLRGLNDQARTVWSQRHALAMRPYEALKSDRAIRGWLLGLPFNAYVYDLRGPRVARGWPHGVAGPSGRLFRCKRLPVFAVAGSPAEGWQAPRPRRSVTPIPEVIAEPTFAFDALRSGARRLVPKIPPELSVSRRIWRPVLQNAA